MLVVIDFVVRVAVADLRNSHGATQFAIGIIELIHRVGRFAQTAILTYVLCGPANLTVLGNPVESCIETVHAEELLCPNNSVHVITGKR